MGFQWEFKVDLLLCSSNNLLIELLYGGGSDGAHDVDVPRMVEKYLAIAIYVSATSVDNPGWPESVVSRMFAQWLISSCLITSKGALFVLGLT